MIISGTLNLTEEEIKTLKESSLKFREEYENNERFREFVDAWNDLDSAPHFVDKNK